jgi:ubiquinone/menaquinone biosynthesis C-methylase UbiE
VLHKEENVKDEAKHIQRNEAKWDQWANTLDGNGWKYEYLRKAQSSVVSLLEMKESVHFLDVGCGTGWAIGEVSSRVNERGEFYGVDLSLKMIEKAKENFSGKNNFHFIKANAELIPLDGDFFDIIICTNSFHHYLHPDKALLEFQRLLKNGGKLYILDPTADTWIIKIADKLHKLIEPEHVKMYSSKEFQQLFCHAGLTYSAVESNYAHEKIHVGKK